MNAEWNCIKFFSAILTGAITHVIQVDVSPCHRKNGARQCACCLYNYIAQINLYVKVKHIYTRHDTEHHLGIFRLYCNFKHSIQDSFNMILIVAETLHYNYFPRPYVIHVASVLKPILWGPFFPGIWIMEKSSSLSPFSVHSHFSTKHIQIILREWFSLIEYFSLIWI